MTPQEMARLCEAVERIANALERTAPAVPVREEATYTISEARRLLIEEATGEEAVERAQREGNYRACIGAGNAEAMRAAIRAALGVEP